LSKTVCVFGSRYLEGSIVRPPGSAEPALSLRAAPPVSLLFRSANDSLHGSSSYIRARSIMMVASMHGRKRQRCDVVTSLFLRQKRSQKIAPNAESRDVTRVTRNDHGEKRTGGGKSSRLLILLRQQTHHGAFLHYRTVKSFCYRASGRNTVLRPKLDPRAAKIRVVNELCRPKRP